MCHPWGTWSFLRGSSKWENLIGRPVTLRTLQFLGIHVTYQPLPPKNQILWKRWPMLLINSHISTQRCIPSCIRNGRIPGAYRAPTATQDVESGLTTLHVLPGWCGRSLWNCDMFQGILAQRHQIQPWHHTSRLAYRGRLASLMGWPRRIRAILRDDVAWSCFQHVTFW
jgi:hypothetical protein